MKYSLIKLLLNEYSDKLINQMVVLYKPQTGDSEEQIKQNIKRFEQLANSISSKLKADNELVKQAVPKELQQGDKAKDITLYKDYKSLVRVLKSVEKKETDIYKQAIEYFKKKERYMDPRTIGMYVSQFKKNKENLEKAVSEKNTNVINLIPQELINKNTYSNILSYKDFNDLEKLIDGAFPFESSGGKGEINSVDLDADKVYDNDSTGIEIYKGDEENKCIKYGKNQYYGWCIARMKGSLYGNYRFLSTPNRMFYFVVDRTQSDEKNERGQFINPYHVVVIHALENGKYTRTTANNDGDLPNGGTDWNNLGEYFNGEDGKKMWDKIKGLQKYMPFIPPSSQERKQQGFKGQKLTLPAFIDLEPEDKTAWLRSNAADRNIITPELVKSLSNEQVNDLINHNRKFSFDELKKSQGLVKRYADYRFTRFPKEPLPYSFIPYLKPELKEKYYEIFGEDYITFNILEKYFGEDYVKKYIKQEIENLGYLPKEATKYMTPEQKQLYDIYSVAFDDASYEEQPVDENSVSAPYQQISIPTISYSTLQQLKPGTKKEFFDLYDKISNNSNNLEKYFAFLLGFPLMFKIDNKKYMVLPKEKNGDSCIIDENGNILYDDIKFIIL
jgi:hypothetical protein